MRKLTIICLLVIFGTTSFSQETSSSQKLTKEDYLLKSKHQKTAAWVMLVGGVAIGVGGAAWAASDWYASAPDVLLVVGGASILGSIPLFIASGKNKRKAMDVSAFIEMQKTPQMQLARINMNSYPALGIKISLL